MATVMSTAPKHDTKLTISTGKSRKDTMWAIKDITWAQLVARLSTSKAGTESHAEYLARSKDEQDNLKDIGGFVGGAVNGGRRVMGSVASRTVFTGDADHANDGFLFDCDIYLPFAHCVYTTRKHGPIAGHRYRLVVPFNRPCDHEEYGAVSRWICNQLGMGLWDKTTLEMNRLMYWPSHSHDVQPQFAFHDREILDVDAVLATYQDYHNIGLWPKFPSEEHIKVGNEVGEHQDPREKPHMIGAFCRVYGIAAAIAEFLPEVYSAGNAPGRFTFAGGTTSNGAVAYDDLHLYSHHQTDPAQGHSVNAFDLVRIHRFGHLDAALDDFERLEVRNLPSQLAMLEWVATLPAVRDEVARTVLGNYDKAQALINDATGEADLRHRVVAELQRIDLEPLDFEKVAQLLQKKLEQLTGAKAKISLCRDLITPPQSLDKQDAPDWLEGFYYVAQDDKFYNTSNGSLLSRSAFNAYFNRKFPHEETPNAADWALNNGLVRAVDLRMYVPYMQPVFNVDGRDCVNTYRPETVIKGRQGELTDEDKAAIATVRKHIRLIFGEQEELACTFEQWMAHNVQQPGVKIRYAWLIKGCEGDGKTTLGNVLAAVMGGPQVKIISLATLTSQFNDYAHGHCVGIFEEIRAVGHNRHDTHTTLKPLITNDRIEIHGKGDKGFDAINTMNYIALTNHADALPLNETERRFGVVFSPYNSAEEIEAKVGNLNIYFERLYSAINNYAPALRTWLETMDISTFNRNARAPMTAEKMQMGQAAKSDLELALEEILDGQTVIFIKTLRDLLEMEHGIHVPNNNTLGRLLPQMGFSCWHKQFKLNGVNSTVWGKGETLPTETCRALLGQKGAESENW